MSRGAEFVQLRAGRRLAYEEYGNRSGAPVFFFHGWPSSRTYAALADRPARDLGLRIIAPDRPGLGDSEFHAGRRLHDWPPLMTEFADHLGCERFRIVAVSGGAPYAFACAHAMPARVEAVAIVCGAPPLAELRGDEGLIAMYRVLLAAYRTAPGILRQLFRLARPLARLQLHRVRPLTRTFLRPCDAEALRDPAAFRAVFGSQQDAWRNSADAVVTDAEVYAQPWGFPLEEIQTPVRLWHGKEDRSFSWRLARDVADRLSNCQAKFLVGEGHYSLPIRHLGEILRDLRDAAAAATPASRASVVSV